MLVLLSRHACFVVVLFKIFFINIMSFVCKNKHTCRNISPLSEQIRSSRWEKKRPMQKHPKVCKILWVVNVCWCLRNLLLYSRGSEILNKPLPTTLTNWDTCLGLNMAQFTYCTSLLHIVYEQYEGLITPALDLLTVLTFCLEVCYYDLYLEVLWIIHFVILPL